MRIQRNKIYAVLSGDVVASTKLTPTQRRALHKALEQVNKSLVKLFGDKLPLGVVLFQGDSWQTVIIKPQLSLRVVLYYRMLLRAKMGMHDVDTRCCIGIGSIKFIPGKQLAGGDGPAFQLSGRGLSQMPRNIRLLIDREDETLSGIDNAHLKTVISLFDALVQRCSDRQALAIALAITGKTQEEIAKAWKPRSISQQAVGQHLDKGGWYAMEQTLQFFEHHIINPHSKGRVV